MSSYAGKNSLLAPRHFSLKTAAQAKLDAIFKGFRFNSLTFYLFMMNCIVWLSAHVSFWWGFQRRRNWGCIQLYYFAKFEPSIVYGHEFWRLILSSFMFKNWVQFYFNNLSLHMMGYVIEAQSRTKFVVVFYGGILAGHLLSCYAAGPEVLTVGTSCGTICLLPVELHRYMKLRRTNPLQAGSRQRFLIFNILSNFVLNVLAVFGITTVDWWSHVGCLVAGLFFYLYFEAGDIAARLRVRPLVVKVVAAPLIIGYYLFLGFNIWFYLPRHGIGLAELERMNFECFPGY